MPSNRKKRVYIVWFDILQLSTLVAEKVELLSYLNTHFEVKEVRISKTYNLFLVRTV